MPGPLCLPTERHHPSAPHPAPNATRRQVGEAPEELRNVLRQRSRWTKGHMQVRAGLGRQRSGRN
jgi:cellulose synthase/poly-beta-1,6-N-acetylglucosamine synthase-like glycosyltransferase